jgi:hypothetical protein
MLGMAGGGGGGKQHENQQWGSWRAGGAGSAARWRTYLAGICAVTAGVLRRARGAPRGKQEESAWEGRGIDGSKRHCGDGDGAFRLEIRWTPPSFFSPHGTTAASLGKLGGKQRRKRKKRGNLALLGWIGPLFCVAFGISNTICFSYFCLLLNIHYIIHMHISNN